MVDLSIFIQKNISKIAKLLTCHPQQKMCQHNKIKQFLTNSTVVRSLLNFCIKIMDFSHVWQETDRYENIKTKKLINCIYFKYFTKIGFVRGRRKFDSEKF